MPGPQNGIVGDDFGIDLPETQIDTTSLDEEKKAARYSKSEEFKKLRAHMEDRISFYQSQLPDGRPLTDAGKNPSLNDWVVANTLIAEFRAVIGYYDQARETVDNVEQ